MIFNEPLKRRPKSRVELHVHLDGALRHETLWEVMRATTSTSAEKAFHSVAVAQVKARWPVAVWILGTLRRRSPDTTVLVVRSDLIHGIPSPARQKGLPLPGNGSLSDLKEALKVQQPRDLTHYLQALTIYLPAIVGDTALIERMAYEFIEDQARDCVAYCEVRFPPHSLLPSHNLTPSEEETHLNGSVNGAMGEKQYYLFVYLTIWYF
ncbi:Adenosine deaminase [Chionoecetes opilio]|uniref:adenosine deaminase n=1 Tax=Chionoecetes opilio TaxID=41210 RepID=A0A8J5CGH0_CHIOP|nr:Adenosine deaminase [Chionoecetes opilio]